MAIKIDPDCGGIPISLCGKRRQMVLKIQYEEIVKNKRRHSLQHIVEKILDKEAEEYFKKDADNN